ncbi:NUDIX domain-containing protein [Tessaracoccus sp. HDW20]|uniref:NUDIX domain-containing protein n=1 Tax=Tessaracoccus coleopterorum TaxID=2714950 RepID=UPI0018D4554A|nr:NUDIX domain-containing protein [Tessaracoccus coleopterorum]NHB84236.1 NUDIX domain-containing protein [Tessaracoccus coleopterorum]
MEIELVAWAIVRDGVGRVLLGRRAGTGRGEGLWNLPGGHVGMGEPVAAAAAREAAEEVGVTIIPADLDVVGVERWEQGALAGSASS